MPAEWGASGARLGFECAVRLQGNWSGAREPLLGAGIQRMVVTATPSFVGRDGEVAVAVGEGGWCCTATDDGAAGALRMFLDFPEGATRNDVSIGAGERVFFTIGCWAEGALERLLGERAALEAEAEAVKEESARLQRRLREGSPWERLVAMREQTALYDKGVNMRARMEGFAQLPSRLDQTARAEGGGARVAGGGGLCVKRKKLLGEEYHILGTFRLTEPS